MGGMSHIFTGIYDSKGEEQVYGRLIHRFVILFYMVKCITYEYNTKPLHYCLSYLFIYLFKLIIVFSTKTVSLFCNRVIKLSSVVTRIALRLSRAVGIYLKMMSSFRQTNRLKSNKLLRLTITQTFEKVDRQWFKFNLLIFLQTKGGIILFYALKMTLQPTLKVIKKVTHI